MTVCSRCYKYLFIWDGFILALSSLRNHSFSHDHIVSWKYLPAKSIACCHLHSSIAVVICCAHQEQEMVLCAVWCRLPVKFDITISTSKFWGQIVILKMKGCINKCIGVPCCQKCLAVPVTYKVLCVLGNIAGNCSCIGFCAFCKMFMLN